MQILILKHPNRFICVTGVGKPAFDISNDQMFDVESLRRVIKIMHRKNKAPPPSHLLYYFVFIICVKAKKNITCRYQFTCRQFHVLST